MGRWNEKNTTSNRNIKFTNYLHKKILWVDDKWDKMGKNVTEKIAKKLNGTCKIWIKKVTGTTRAVNELDKNKYDLVISDMERNENDSGLNLLKLLNRTEKTNTKYPPVLIFHERQAKEKYLIKAKELKAAEAISKSQPRDLINRIAEKFGLEI